MNAEDKALLEQVKEGLENKRRLDEVNKEIIDTQAKEIVTLKEIIDLQADFILDLEKKIFDLELDNII